MRKLNNVLVIKNVSFDVAQGEGYNKETSNCVK